MSGNSSVVAVPQVRSQDVQLRRFVESVKWNLDVLTGQAQNSGKLEPLAATASLAAVVTALNEIIRRMGGV